MGLGDIYVSTLDVVVDLQKREAATIRIQTVHRGVTARAEVRERREVQAKATADEAAAIRIQTVHRGVTARAEVREWRAFAQEAQAKAKEDEAKAQEDAAVKIQARYRGTVTREKFASGEILLFADAGVADTGEAQLCADVAEMGRQESDARTEGELEATIEEVRDEGSAGLGAPDAPQETTLEGDVSEAAA